MSFFTPNTKCRRLGLGRSVNKVSAKKANQDGSATKEHDDRTPNRDNSLDSIVFSSSQKRKYRLGTNCRPNYKKKKLEFIEQCKENVALELSETIEKLGVIPSLTKENVTTTKDADASSSNLSSSAFFESKCKIMDEASLKKEIEEKREIVLKLKDHESKVQQLKGSIEQWRSTLITSLSELSSKIEPNKSPEEILNLLNIPIEIINTKQL